MASPELTRTIELIASSPLPEDADVAAWRAAYNRLGELQFPDASVACEATDAAGVAAEWLTPRSVDDGRTILYLHGGGYVLGGPTTHRSMGTHLATRARGRLLLLDYRLAPEHPFPAAVEDAVTAYEWLVGPYGADPGRVVIAGDSAGGGLTAATLVALRDRGAPLPAGAVCISPWTDLEGTGATAETHAAVDPMVSDADLRRWATVYLAGADPRSPLASPIHADLEGLPPLLIVVGEREMLLDDARRLAERARGADVEVELDEVPECIHVWQFFAGRVPEADEGIARIADFVVARTRD